MYLTELPGKFILSIEKMENIHIRREGDFK